MFHHRIKTQNQSTLGVTKPRHIVKYCRSNKKLRNLDLNEGILSQISNLFTETSNDEKEASAQIKLENN